MFCEYCHHHCQYRLEQFWTLQRDTIVTKPVAAMLCVRHSRPFNSSRKAAPAADGDYGGRDRQVRVSARCKRPGGRSVFEGDMFSKK